MDNLPRKKQKHGNDLFGSSMNLNDLPLHLLDDILFRLELKSLAMIRCTNKYFQSHISNDPNFEVGYSSGAKAHLFHLSSYGANYVYCLPLASSCDSRSFGKEANLLEERCYILGSCSGLLLLYIGGLLFVANPITKRFRILDHSGSKLIPKIVGGDNIINKDASYPEGNVARTERAMCVGFAVNRNQTTKRLKIVCILEMEKVYRFEISDGDSWRLSETTITTTSKSELTTRMKPVYLDDTFYWLRNDGSIIAFNPETEQACLIRSRFQQKPDMKLLLTKDDKIKCLTLISGTEEALSVYTLLENHKWAPARRIKNVYMNEHMLKCWNVVAYDGKFLVVREKKVGPKDGVFHVYDMKTNNWGVLGSTTSWSNSVRDFYKFTPSLFFVEEDEPKKMVVTFDDLRITYLTTVMGLIDTTK